MVDKVDDQSLDVGAVVILVGHNHEFAVAQGAHILVDGVKLESQNLHDVLDFFILLNLFDARLSHIQEFSP